MKSILQFSLLILLLLCGTTSAQTDSSSNFDDLDANNGRHGFIIGFGIGPGFTHISQSADPELWYFGTEQFGDDPTKFSINTDFKIGFVADEQTLIYWNSEVAWLRDETSHLEQDTSNGSFHTVRKNEIFASSLSGIGLTYYTRPTLPSWFVSATLGFASLGTPFKEKNHAEGGFGASVGLGYEFAPHWTMEGVVTYCRTTDDPINSDAISFKTHIGVLSF